MSGIVTTSPSCSGRVTRPLFAGSSRSGWQFRNPASTARLHNVSVLVAITVIGIRTPSSLVPHIFVESGERDPTCARIDAVYPATAFRIQAAFYYSAAWND